MRIGLDVSQTCAQRAGCAWYADSLARAMVENAPENQYILYHQFGNWINQDTSSGTFIEHPAVQMPFWRTDPEQTREAWRRSGAEGSLVGDPEIVQSNSFQVVPTPGAKLIFVAYDVSFWVFPEFTTEANRLNCQRGVLEALERADGFLFISESAKAEFEAILPGWLERNNKPAAAIPLASRLYPNTGAKISECFWLAVGSIEPRKNYRALFEAVELYWHRSKHPSPLWIAASEGWRNDEIRTKAAKLEAAGMIRMLGYVSEERLAALYGQALALVFPSWYEGFGLPVLEAMQCGCAVICSNTTSLPEVGGDIPIYIDPGRPESICDAMIYFEQDAARRHWCQEAGIRRAQQFSWKRTALATLDFYRKILEN